MLPPSRSAFSIRNNKKDRTLTQPAMGVDCSRGDSGGEPAAAIAHLKPGATADVSSHQATHRQPWRKFRPPLVQQPWSWRFKGCRRCPVFFLSDLAQAGKESLAK